MTEQAKCNVVVADDAEQLRELLCRALARDPRVNVVGQASDGAEALAVVERAEPDVLLLDLSMPVLDGLEVLRRVRETHPSVAVVVFSGYGSGALESTCRDLGASGYIEKGTPMTTVVEAILNAAGKQT